MVRQRLRPHGIDFESWRLTAAASTVARSATTCKADENVAAHAAPVKYFRFMLLPSVRLGYDTRFGSDGTRYCDCSSCCSPCGAAAHDIPSDVDRPRVRPSRWASSFSCWCACRSSAIRDLDFPEDERGYLDIEKLAPLLPDAATVRIADLMEIHEGSRTSARASGEPRRRSRSNPTGSFDSFDEALRHVTAPKLPNIANVVWNQVLFDVLLEYPIQSDRSDFSIRPGFQRLAARVVTVLRFVPPGGAVRAYEFRGDPGWCRSIPRWHQAARRFVELGFCHILDGTDHLLFLLCLVIPVRRFGRWWWWSRRSRSRTRSR